MQICLKSYKQTAEQKVFSRFELGVLVIWLQIKLLKYLFTYCFCSVNIHQACISEDGSFAQAGQHLEALKELCDTLSPEDAHRLAQTQLRECENRLAAIQRQFSGDQEAQIPDSR